MKDRSRCKPRVQTAEDLTAACLARLNSLHQQISLSTQALSRISWFFTIPGNTNARFISPKGFVIGIQYVFPFPLSVDLYVSLSSALFWDIPQCIVVIPTRRFVTTYRSHLQGSRNIPLYILPFFIFENANDTLFRNVGRELTLYARYNITEESRSRLFRGETLK
jgi:hypothetical protein